MSARIPATMRILRAMIDHGDYPGLTRGDIRRIADLPIDSEVTRPTRDLRKAGIKIECKRVFLTTTRCQRPTCRCQYGNHIASSADFDSQMECILCDCEDFQGDPDHRYILPADQLDIAKAVLASRVRA